MAIDTVNFYKAKAVAETVIPSLGKIIVGQEYTIDEHTARNFGGVGRDGKPIYLEVDFNKPIKKRVQVSEEDQADYEANKKALEEKAKRDKVTQEAKEAEAAAVKKGEELNEAAKKSAEEALAKKAAEEAAKKAEEDQAKAEAKAKADEEAKAKAEAEAKAKAEEAAKTGAKANESQTAQK